MLGCKSHQHVVSICGRFSCPTLYTSIPAGKITQDQVVDYAARKKMVRTPRADVVGVHATARFPCITVMETATKLCLEGSRKLTGSMAPLAEANIVPAVSPSR